VSWSLNDDLELIYGDPIAIWKDWADNVGGCGIESGATSPKKIQLLSQPRVQGLSLMSAAKLVDAPMWEWQFSIPIANTRPIGREIARHTAMR